MLDKGSLHNVCNRGIAKTRKLGKFKLCTKNSGYTFIDNDAKILAVAHIDTVQSSHQFSAKGNKIFSPRLDDRLGVYTITELLPQLGVVCDVLLCEDEEQGRSTAQYFKTDKKYNWIFEFDRGGTDVVMYQYATQDYYEMLEESNYIVGEGSYSDICDLEHLGITAFNFGVAYYNYHSLNAYMKIDEYLESIARFVEFYNEYKDIKMDYDPSESFYIDSYWLNPRHYSSDSLLTYSRFDDNYCTGCGMYSFDEDEIAFLKDNGLCIYCDEFLSQIGEENLRHYLDRRQK